MSERETTLKKEDSGGVGRPGEVQTGKPLPERLINRLSMWSLIVKWTGNVSEDDLKELFNPLGAESVVMLKSEVEICEGQAQINFKTQSDAQNALDETEASIESRILYIKDLSPLTTDDDLKKLFEEVGQVDSAVIATTKSGISGGFGFVTMCDIETARIAVTVLNKRVLDGRIIEISFSRSQPDSPGSIKPEAIFTDYKTAHQQENAIIHALDNYNHSTVAYNPVITKGIIIFEGIFYNYKDFQYQIGIADSTVIFDSKKEPGDIKYKGKTVCYKNNGCITHMNNIEIAGNAKIEDGQTVALEVNMSTTPRTLTFFINGQQQPIQISNIPPSLKFWVLLQWGQVWNTDVMQQWSLNVKWTGDLTEEDLQLLFYPLGAESVVILKSEVEINEGQAQINFKTQLDAQNALDQTNNKIIKGSILEVEIQQQQIKDQINSQGELLYEQIKKIDGPNAGKITGMLLELDIQDLVKMLEDPHLLFRKVQKAKKF
ncbi:MAG: hypothetical protein EZS28_028451 [Streblomastix strix]|uniref:Polyadenylate-binding protein n=1 Tax=Streblomastix strix TaxID=222440 RepID=A0A5J4V0J6_9EUKA|nr:MAG: hypothetical protein EZS28_028451 [Streblomastix strix]